MSGLRAFVIAGPGAQEALDWLHVHCDVLGAIEDEGSVTVWLAGDLPELPQQGVSVREVAAGADREITGLEHDAPIRVADDLLVRPPWVERPPDFTGIELIVPRGSAFGSGEHGSTQAALRCLHRVWDGPRSVADVGTGSGILALYAVVRGCADVQACDVDDYAVAAARELLPDARVSLGGAETMVSADCVVANMTAAELSGAMDVMLARWSRRSALVLSGMRAHEVAAIRARVRETVVAEEHAGEFTALAFRAR